MPFSVLKKFLPRLESSKATPAIAPQQHRPNIVPTTMRAVLDELSSSPLLGIAVGCVAVFVGSPVLIDGFVVTCALFALVLL